MDKITAVTETVDVWRGLLKAVPSGAAERTAIMLFLDRLAETPEQIIWLRNEVVARYNEWPGARSIRGLYCGRFKPADGIEADADPAITAEAEMRYITHADELKRLEDQPCRETRRLLGPKL